mgnify:CR=1 FL=1|jgi:hypothetical protein
MVRSYAVKYKSIKSLTESLINVLLQIFTIINHKANHFGVVFRNDTVRNSMTNRTVKLH